MTDPLIPLVCKRFCRFYREGEKEDLACGGYLALEASLESGRTTENALNNLPGEIGLDPEGDQILFEWVCRTCPFLADGCDYRDEAVPPPKYPCGGFIALLGLMRRGP